MIFYHAKKTGRGNINLLIQPNAEELHNVVLLVGVTQLNSAHSVDFENTLTVTGLNSHWHLSWLGVHRNVPCQHQFQLDTTPFYALKCILYGFVCACYRT